MFETSRPTTSISRGSPTPSPRSWARRMNWSESGSKPMSFAETASIATMSLDARIRFLTWGRMADPGNAGIGEMDAWDLEAVLNCLVLVAELAGVGIDDDRAVMGSEDVVVTGVAQRLRHAFDLPGRRRAAGVPVLPGDVDLEG